MGLMLKKKRVLWDRIGPVHILLLFYRISKWEEKTIFWNNIQYFKLYKLKSQFVTKCAHTKIELFG